MGVSSARRARKGGLPLAALVVGSFALVFALVATPAVAAESPLTLTWVAPPACPPSSVLEADVERLLGGSVAAKPVVARAEVARRGDASWQVVLTTQQQGARGHRTLEGPTCAAVASAAALILALTIDPVAAARASAPAIPPPAPPAVAPPPTAPSPPPPPPPAPTIAVPAPLPSAATRREAGYGGVVRVSPVLGAGVVPDRVAFGLGVSAGVTRGLYSLELSGTAFLPASHDAPGLGGTGGTFHALAVATLACGTVVDGPRLRGGGCGGLEYQHLEADGYGVTRPGKGAADWTAPTVAPFVDVALTSWLWFDARVAAGVPLRRPTFGIDGVGPVARVNPAFLHTSLGAEVRF